MPVKTESGMEERPSTLANAASTGAKMVASLSPTMAVSNLSFLAAPASVLTWELPTISATLNASTVTDKAYIKAERTIIMFFN